MERAVDHRDHLSARAAGEPQRGMTVRRPLQALLALLVALTLTACASDGGGGGGDGGTDSSTSAESTSETSEPAPEPEPEPEPTTPTTSSSSSRGNPAISVADGGWGRDLSLFYNSTIASGASAVAASRKSGR